MTYRPKADELLKALDAVYYEIKQLVDMIAPTTGHPALDNAVVESRLLHVRNLLDFFAFDARNNDDVLAAHYAFPLKPVTINSTYDSRLNKDLAHLTYARTRRTQVTKSWPVHLVVAPVLQRCSEFIAHILATRSVFADVGPTEWRALEMHIRDGLDSLRRRQGI